MPDHFVFVGWHTQAEICQLLKKTAVELCMAVVVVNYVTFPRNTSFRPALGQWWAALAHVRLAMRAVEDSECDNTLIRVLKSIRKVIPLFL